MTRAQQNNLFSERAALERMIAETSESDVIDLRSLKVRLELVNQQLKEFIVDTRLSAKAQLTFRGRPVIGSHGIFAEFGTTVTKSFTDAVGLLAASLQTELAATGPIPNRTQNQLLITNTALGSFGFELEEYREGALLLEDESPVGEALKQVQALMRGAVEGSDDELTDVASGQDPRAVAAVREFLKKLIDSEAVCCLTIGDKVFGFNDVGEVRRSLLRLGQENLHESAQTFTGSFQGCLPKRRTFEFKVTETGEVIAGKIVPTITSPGAINDHLHQELCIQLIATRVGQALPKFVLTQLPAW
jgi:hypothetical protein